MAKATFTARWVASLKPPAEGQVDYFRFETSFSRATRLQQWPQNLVHHVPQWWALTAFDSRHLSRSRPG